MLMTIGRYRHYAINTALFSATNETSEEVLTNSRHVTRDQQIPLVSVTQGSEHASGWTALRDGVRQQWVRKLAVTVGGTNEGDAVADARQPAGNTFNQGSAIDVGEQRFVGTHPTASPPHEHEARWTPHAKIITSADESSCGHTRRSVPQHTRLSNPAKTWLG
jgi:hypothetical protein